ncbi:kynurenine 3-monooxygenase [Xylariaceae sp. FL1651]|nr:kynurenine 3-monooxygenase [Xylariaceae sp. FL1651]
MLSSTESVAIIGGGLAGMAAALALHGLSIMCSVYEMRDTNAAPPTSSGAVMLSPNALRILDSFGVYHKIEQKSYPFEYMYYKNADEQNVDHYPLGNESTFGYKALRVYRQDLLDVLYEACFEREIPIHFGKKFAEVIDESDIGVSFRFTNGTTETASLLIGSDGIHSRLREYVTPGVQKRFMGLTALTWETPTKQLRIPEEKDYKFPVTVLTANGAFVLAPQRTDGSAMLAGTQIPIEESLAGDREKWNNLFADKQGLIERARKNLDVWPDIVKSSMDNINPESINLWAFYAIPRLQNWTSKKHHRVVILGDAAHAIPPTTGQGASQAFEDVITLTLLLSELKKNPALNWEDALQFWQKMRQNRIDDLLVLTKQLNNKRLPLEEQKLLGKDDVWVDQSAENPDQMAWLYVPKIEETVKRWATEAKEKMV